MVCYCLTIPEFVVEGARCKPKPLEELRQCQSATSSKLTIILLGFSENTNFHSYIYRELRYELFSVLQTADLAIGGNQFLKSSDFVTKLLASPHRNLQLLPKIHHKLYTNTNDKLCFLSKIINNHKLCV